MNLFTGASKEALTAVKSLGGGRTGLDEAALKTYDKSSFSDTAGLYAHNAMANIASSSWSKSIGAGAGIGAVWGGGSGYLDGQGVLGSAAAGAFTGGMMGAGVRFGAGAYAKNAASLGADNGFMHQYADTVGGKSVKRYATSLQANSEPGVNPFSWDNFFGA